MYVGVKNEMNLIRAFHKCGWGVRNTDLAEKTS